MVSRIRTSETCQQFHVVSFPAWSPSPSSVSETWHPVAAPLVPRSSGDAPVSCEKNGLGLPKTETHLGRLPLSRHGGVCITDGACSPLIAWMDRLSAGLLRGRSSPRPWAAGYGWMVGSESGVQRGPSANGNSRGWCAYFGRRLVSWVRSLVCPNHAVWPRDGSAHHRLPSRPARWQTKSGVAEGYIGPPSPWSVFCVWLIWQTKWTAETIPASTMNLPPHKQPVFEASVTNR